METVTEWLAKAMSEEDRPSSLDSVTAEMLTEGIRKKYSRCYSVQIMLPAEIRHLAFCLCSHLYARSDEHELQHDGRKIFVDVQQEPSVQKNKDLFFGSS